ncbi:hypothetical protein EVAR_76578_1 [Eumeta japonica]|uniref:Uncharacterized protein n=1 Tax=Eumeta variegata TaxID=151549 RepID=A0A4C1T5X3_EUMVA|nr:hypothetical protein EVAR_76578_1 [Eumeta japonica]
MSFLRRYCTSEISDEFRNLRVLNGAKGWTSPFGCSSPNDEVPRSRKRGDTGGSRTASDGPGVALGGNVGFGLPRVEAAVAGGWFVSAISGKLFRSQGATGHFSLLGLGLLREINLGLRTSP